MDKIMTALFKIDKILRNWPTHLALIVLWVYGLTLNNFFTYWIISGLIVYIGLCAYQLYKGYNAFTKEFISKNGFLPLLIGFNYSIFLGVLSFGLFFLLANESPANQENDS